MPTKIDARMGVFDAVMWGVETDPLLRSVITVVVFLDQKPDREVVTRRIEEMSLRVPALRRRVVGNPVSLVPPRWESSEFDLDYHLQFRRAPGKRDERAVLGIAEHLAEQDFDRARPLWECYVVDGMVDDRAALILKIHHAITDGIGGMAMAASLFDLSADPGARPEEELPPPDDEDEADFVHRVTESVQWQGNRMVGQAKSLVGKGTGLVGSAFTDPVGTAKGSADFTASAARLLAPASNPMSPVMRGRSLGVHFSQASLPLSHLKAAGKRNGGTLNDAFMAIVSGAIAKYHARHGVTLDEAPAVRVNMPVNLRPKGDAPVQGNRWVPARFPLPLGPEDPAERIAALSPVLKGARTEPALEISEPIFRLLTSLPRTATTAIAGGMMKGTDVAATNVPGPPIPVYIAGAKVESLVPFAPKGGAALNIALMTYNGIAELGINIDTAAIYDHEVMLECIAEALAEVDALGAVED
jgi:WS/DGAT/MGAT family acyltransferase